jgi:hypothetical protein
VRVVGKPITPYLQWELNSHTVWTQCGEKYSVVSEDQVAPFEESGLLPEIITLGADVMYEILYDETGILYGGVRFTDRDLIARCQKFIQHLYSIGEDFDGFFEREVAGLEPPRSA